MRMVSCLLAAILVIAVADRGFAGKYNKTLSIGDAAPDFRGLKGVDGQQHSLKDLADREVLVICFLCNTCEYALDAEKRLMALADKFAAEGGRCEIIAINPNLVKDDLLPAMKERAEARGINFLYLHDDPKQQTAKCYGVTYTPECIVLNKERKVVYLGSLDDSPDGKQVSKKYVEEAIAAALAGKEPAVAETPAVGCAVRWARVRRQLDE